MHPSQPKISTHSSALWWPLLSPPPAWHVELRMEMVWLEFQFQHFPGSLECQKHLLGNFGSYFHLVENGSIKICCKISQMASSAKSNALISEFESQCQVHKIEPREHKTGHIQSSITQGNEVLVSVLTVYWGILSDLDLMLTAFCALSWRLFLTTQR